MRSTPADPEMLVATGFLRMGPWELTGMEVAKIARQRFLDDVTNSVGETFLAHSLQCARCHDHKFDPVPDASIIIRSRPVFATTQLAERPAPFLPEENTAGFERKSISEKARGPSTWPSWRSSMPNCSPMPRLGSERGKLDPAKWNAAVAQGETPQGRGKNPRRGFPMFFGSARKSLAKQGVPEDRVSAEAGRLHPRGVRQRARRPQRLERLKWELDRYEPYAFSVYNGRTPEMKSVTSRCACRPIA
jgi:hypothetical protein